MWFPIKSDLWSSDEISNLMLKYETLNTKKCHLKFQKDFCKKFKEKRKFWSLVISYRGKGKKRIYAYRRTSTMVQKSVTSKDFGFAQRSYSCKISREVKRLQSLFIQSFQKLCLKITPESLILKFSNIFLKNRLFRFVLRNSKLKGKGGKSKL